MDEVRRLLEQKHKVKKGSIIHTDTLLIDTTYSNEEDDLIYFSSGYNVVTPHNPLITVYVIKQYDAQPL